MATEVLEDDKVYAAGFVDGEGCLEIADNKYIKRGKIQYYPRITVTNTDWVVLEWFKERWGGIILAREYPSKPKHWQKSWNWRVSMNTAMLFLKDIFPYLKVKRAQAVVLLKYNETCLYEPTGSAHRLTDEAQAKRAELKQTLHEMKSGGTR